MYIEDTADFFDKLKDLGEIPEGAILATADVVKLYKFLHKKVPTEDIKMADFVLKKISATTIGTKFASYPMLVLLLRQNFLRHNLQNHGCGDDSLIMYFLFIRTVKKTLRDF